MRCSNFPRARFAEFQQITRARAAGLERSIFKCDKAETSPAVVSVVHARRTRVVLRERRTRGMKEF